MSDDAPVVWLDDGGAREDAGRALAEWARARGIRLRSLDESAPSIPVDLSLADRTERELERAREAIGGADADTAERALARAESLLREHPELPQAAWLRAEVERTWSARFHRVEPRDEARAATAWANAQALDGGRVRGIGEADGPPRARVKATLVVSGGRRSGVSLHLDGVPLEPDTTPSSHDGTDDAVYQVALVPGDHHVLAVDDGRVAFASWMSIVGSEPPPTRLAIDGPACSRGRFAALRKREGRIDAKGVTCPRWVAAATGDKLGSVFVARCEQDACGPLLEWRLSRFAKSAPLETHSTTARWPIWATWTLVGIGAAAATMTGLLAGGVFDPRPVPGEQRFVFGGVRQE
ncbi:MAG TPA: hypothetical protein VM580_18075 [Labilithrix sp.]|nr:hypothetical protein [Labilithrix sp.]